VKLEFRGSFTTDLKRIKDKGLLQRVREIIDTLEKADSLIETSNLKRLKGGGNYFRLRIGDYRLGIALE
jgi:mRNA interferase RelE/StbE